MHFQLQCCQSKENCIAQITSKAKMKLAVLPLQITGRFREEQLDFQTFFFFFFSQSLIWDDRNLLKWYFTHFSVVYSQVRESVNDKEIGVSGFYDNVVISLSVPKIHCLSGFLHNPLLNQSLCLYSPQ